MWKKSNKLRVFIYYFFFTKLTALISMQRCYKIDFQIIILYYPHSSISNILLVHQLAAELLMKLNAI